MLASLVVLRIAGGLIGLIIFLLAFSRFRNNLIRRHDFLLWAFCGLSLVTIASVPDTVSSIAGILSLSDIQFGRIITLLVLSSLLLWIIVLGLRARDYKN